MLLLLSERINKHYSSLNDTEIYILKKILALQTEIDKLGIEELARKCDTSKSSIMRLTQKIGFSGYSEFKSYVKWEKNKKPTMDEDNFTCLEEDFLQTIKQMKDSTQIERLAEKIKESDQIILYGTGQAQRHCAMEMQRIFMQVNKHMYFISASDEFSLTTKNLKENDLVIVLSLSGNIQKVEDSLRTLKLNNVPIASITNMQNNPLSSMADYRLYAISSPMSIDNGLLHNSFTNFLLVIEYIFRSYFYCLHKK